MIDKLLRHLEEERQKALKEWQSNTSFDYWKGYSFAMLNIITWINSHRDILDINYIEKDKVRKAYEEINKNYFHARIIGGLNELADGMNKALCILEEHCPEVLEEQK